jgi:DNA/RNA endonuclease G (NUC1)
LRDAGSNIISRADLNVNLSGRSGFTLDNSAQGKNPHLNTFAWYAGTADLSLKGEDSAFGTQILRRRGDFSQDVFNDGTTYQPWYTNDLTPVNPLSDELQTVPFGSEDGQWEGVGTGWYYSAIGGGYWRRSSLPVATTPRTPVGVDNTNLARSRGDYAVPTLFNGNFDAIDQRKPTQPIPGWSLNGQNVDAVQFGLKKWDQITGLTQRYNRLAIDPNSAPGNPVNGQFEHPSYLETIGYDPTRPNYAIELQGGDTLIHNSFVVPENGRLRFNAYIEDPAQDSDKTNFIRMFLVDEENGIETELSGLPLATPPFIISPADVIKNGATVTALDLREVKPNITSNQPMQSQTNRIGFGSYGFETFSVDIPSDSAGVPLSIRGKAAKLKIVVNGNKKVYLDDIFFSSEHLLPGNLTKAKGELEAGLNLTNFLVEKPGYALSYNNDLKTANWASYKLDRSWMNSDAVNQRPDFVVDFQLNHPATINPYPKFIPVGANAVDGENSIYQRGHIVDARQRERIVTSKTNPSENILKDYYSTFVMSDAFPEVNLSLPQFKDPLTGKSPTDPWVNLAIFLSGTLVGTYDQSLQQFTGRDKELYILAGRDGEKAPIPEVKVSIPESLWRVVLVLNHGQKISDVTQDNMAFAVYIPNDVSRGNQNWQNSQYLMSVAALEQQLNQDGGSLDFFSNLAPETRSRIKNRTYADIYNWVTGGVYPLLAEAVSSSDFISVTGKDTLPISDSTRLFQHLSDTSSTSKITLQPNGTVSISPLEIRVPQIGISKDSVAKTTATEVDITTVDISTKTSMGEARSSQISSINADTLQLYSKKTSFTEVGTTHGTAPKTSTSQVNTAQIFSRQVANRDASKGEISSTSSVETQNFITAQILVEHNLSRQVQNIELAAISLWQQQLNSTTPIDLNFEITNLPTGHLAEGTITSYNTNGTPKTATISIDDDANGVGWFFDTTPGDNSEFTGVDNYLQATPNSPASGKYDLLTAILHEMGHTFGIINGYSEFDKHIKNGKFITTDSPNGAKITLTPDGSHLDSTLYPYDLMNTSLKPGIRKLPSILDLSILNALWS